MKRFKKQLERLVADLCSHRQDIRRVIRAGRKRRGRQKTRPCSLAEIAFVKFKVHEENFWIQGLTTIGTRPEIGLKFRLTDLHPKASVEAIPIHHSLSLQMGSSSATLFSN